MAEGTDAVGATGATVAGGVVVAAGVAVGVAAGARLGDELLRRNRVVGERHRRESGR